MEILCGIIAVLAIVGFGVVVYRINNKVASLVGFVSANSGKIESHERTLHKLYGKFGAIARAKNKDLAEAELLVADSTSADPQKVATSPGLTLVKKYGDPEFALRLKNIMAKKGITQAKVAIELGITPPAVCQWLRGDRMPSRDNIDLLAMMLDVDADYLIHGDPRAKTSRCG